MFQPFDSAARGHSAMKLTISTIIIHRLPPPQTIMSAAPPTLLPSTNAVAGVVVGKRGVGVWG